VYEDAHRRRRPVRAKAIGVSRNRVDVELPGELRGFIRRADLGDEARIRPHQIVGEEVEGLVLEVDREQRKVVISPRHLAMALCEAAAGKNRTVPAHVRWANRGGLVLDVYGHRGFLPRSELRPADAMDHARFAGTSRDVYVISVDDEQVVASAFPPRVRKLRTPS
jgi:small subunit ribosomal protein S1